MLHCARDSNRDVQLRTDEPSGLSDLVAMRTPAVIGDCTRGADCRISECRGEFFDQPEILRGFEATSAGDHYRRFGQIELSTGTLPRLDHLHTCGRRIQSRLSVFDTTCLRILSR